MREVDQGLLKHQGSYGGPPNKPAHKIGMTPTDYSRESNPNRNPIVSFLFSFFFSKLLGQTKNSRSNLLWSRAKMQATQGSGSAATRGLAMAVTLLFFSDFLHKTRWKQKEVRSGSKTSTTNQSNPATRHVYAAKIQQCKYHDENCKAQIGLDRFI